jgi:hypothetical protein
MIEQPPDTLTHTHQQLQAKADELQSLQELLFTGDASVIDRHKLIIEQIRDLKESYQKQCEAFTTELPDGQRLFTPHYEALKAFARNNELSIQELPEIRTEGGFAIACGFSGIDLTTLEGLQEIQTIQTLKVSFNRELKSLKGLPTSAIQEIDATCCGLTGDLSELRDASQLKKIDVFGNRFLTSLKGIPTQMIEDIDASHCGLKGDLSALCGASKLKRLLVVANKALLSLKGVPMQSIEEIDADYSNLKGDHTFLSEARHLRTLHLRRRNAKPLSLDKTKFPAGMDIQL